MHTKFVHRDMHSEVLLYIVSLSDADHIQFIFKELDIAQAEIDDAKMWSNFSIENNS